MLERIGVEVCKVRGCNNPVNFPSRLVVLGSKSVAEMPASPHTQNFQQTAHRSAFPKYDRDYMQSQCCLIRSLEIAYVVSIEPSSRIVYSPHSLVQDYPYSGFVQKIPESGEQGTV